MKTSDVRSVAAAFIARTAAHWSAKALASSVAWPIASATAVVCDAVSLFARRWA